MKFGVRMISVTAASLLASSTLSALKSQHPAMTTRPAGPNAVALESIRDQGDLRAQRRVAWESFAQLVMRTDGTGTPAFESWHGEHSVFAVVAAEPEQRGIHGFSRGDSSGDGPHASPSADAPILTYTLYNDAAYQHIRVNRLHLSTELSRLRHTGSVDRSIPGNRSIADFPQQAAILKTAWWPVAHDRATAMPVWDARMNPPRTGGNDYTSWARVVAVDPRHSGSEDGTASIEFMGRSIRNAPKFEVRDFYHVAVDATLASHLAEDSNASKAAWVALGRPIEAGDFLVLVGANLATKQIQDWVWATLWWHDRANDPEFGADRPPLPGGAWRHYLLQAAFDSSKPTAANGGPHVCFNPWLEGRFPDGGMGGGTVSNCQSCHRRASYPAMPFLPVTRGPPDLKNDPAYRQGRLRTNFIWALALHDKPEIPPSSIP